MSSALPDGVNFFNVLLQPNYGWRYLKPNLSANTAVTLTADFYVF
jgi:hypothetical protein